MTVTIKELAGRAKVSIATVSRALNNDPKVKPETRDLILSLASQLEYKPNILARNFVKKKSNIIGIVLPEAVDGFFTEFIRGIGEVACASGYNTMIADTHKERTIIESINNFSARGVVDGIILMAPSLTDRLKNALSRCEIPVVIISGSNDLEEYDTVGIDNFQGAYSITDYLIKSMGYKKIAHITGPALNADALDRKAGYLKALQDNGLFVCEDWIIDGDFTVKGGQNACLRLLSLPEKPEAIFASNDMTAIGCYKAVESFGLKIPDDVGIAGYDDVFVSQFLTPRLTTVHVPIQELGRTSAILLTQRIKEGKKFQEGILKRKHIKISTGVVVGKSCKFHD
ncbi:MAG: LacI family transcriptional regulator [Ignavibacteria bacterium]|jgi:LacI family transcriptional regulator|nr:LacI family transcriptional regulator [Ignavibacteria bacterium]MCU7504560.1 LacI family transcriptional regulator [Ignavibacteria bacterium]MCU7516602.1 LacI family transcriptional regulator [Ignavibacteria bacterium]